MFRAHPLKASLFAGVDPQMFTEVGKKGFVLQLVYVRDVILGQIRLL